MDFKKKKSNWWHENKAGCEPIGLHNTNLVFTSTPLNNFVFSLQQMAQSHNLPSENKKMEKYNLTITFLNVQCDNQTLPHL